MEFFVLWNCNYLWIHSLLLSPHVRVFVHMDAPALVSNSPISLLMPQIPSPKFLLCFFFLFKIILLPSPPRSPNFNQKTSPCSIPLLATSFGSFSIRSNNNNNKLSLSQLIQQVKTINFFDLHLSLHRNILNIAKMERTFDDNAPALMLSTSGTKFIFPCKDWHENESIAQEEALFVVAQNDYIMHINEAHHSTSCPENLRVIMQLNLWQQGTTLLLIFSTRPYMYLSIAPFSLLFLCSFILFKMFVNNRIWRSTNYCEHEQIELEASRMCEIFPTIL